MNLMKQIRVGVVATVGRTLSFNPDNCPIARGVGSLITFMIFYAYIKK